MRGHEVGEWSESTAQPLATKKETVGEWSVPTAQPLATKKETVGDDHWSSPYNMIGAQFILSYSHAEKFRRLNF